MAFLIFGRLRRPCAILPAVLRLRPYPAANAERVPLLVSIKSSMKRCSRGSSSAFHGAGSWRCLRGLRTPSRATTSCGISPTPPSKSKSSYRHHRTQRACLKTLRLEAISAAGGHLANQLKQAPRRMHADRGGRACPHHPSTCTAPGTLSPPPRQTVSVGHPSASARQLLQAQ